MIHIPIGLIIHLIPLFTTCFGACLRENEERKRMRREEERRLFRAVEVPQHDLEPQDLEPEEVKRKKSYNQEE